jgi:hypothetical protein
VIAILALASSACTRPVQLASVHAPAPPPASPVRSPDARHSDRGSGPNLDPDVDRDRDDKDDDEADERASRANALDAYRFFLAQRVRPGDTQLPFDKYAAARAHARQMPAFSFARPQASNPSFSNGWTSLGPGNVGGRTRSILIDPTSPSTVYAGAVTGGVWKTTDGGNTWTPLTDLLPVLNIGALAMDPTNSQIIYAGTGESYTGFPGQGIFKSTNGGTTWTLLPATSTFIYTNKLKISANNAQRIYAATSTGVWTSADAGTTWTQSLGNPANGC